MLQSQYRARQFNILNASATLTRADLGKLLSNNGATGTVTYVLPTNAVPGDRFTVDAVVAQTIKLDPGAAGTIQSLATVSTAGQKVLTDGTAGPNFQIYCVAAGFWKVIAVTGTLAFA